MARGLGESDATVTCVPVGLRHQKRNDYSNGGFKFQVQRVNDGAVAHRLPGASQN